jgi:tungstate transport system substrate-binding protein
MIQSYSRKYKYHPPLFLLLCALCFSLSGCFRNLDPDSQPPLEADQTIILATTTSTYDSGLLDVLIPVFEIDRGYTVKIIAVGTGKALAMGKQGNADILLVHAPQSELEFMAGGFGVDRYLVMHNDFVIVGPPSDPANIRTSGSPEEAFQRIQRTNSGFVSRGDDSGTHKKELILWDEGGGLIHWDYYNETGQGMGATLWIASELGAYNITDRATYLSQKDMMSLDVLLEGFDSLLNIYHAITINPMSNAAINHTGANELASFLISAKGQEIIRTYGVDKYGEALFFPDAGLEEQ